jgi:hypothetical protein
VSLAHSVGKLREEDEELFGESFTSLKSGSAVEKQHYFHISAVYLARATLGIRDASEPADEFGSGFFSKTLKFYSGYGAVDLMETVMELHKLHEKAQDAVLKSVFDKFKSEKFGLVSLKIPVVKEVLSESFDIYKEPTQK